MRSSKSRSRNKSNRQRTLGNIVNRVFDSSGPEGKVRGTPQQIIEKYLMLARDAQLSNDRVAEQSFLQHAEHYTRLLGEAQREQAERQQQFSGHRDDDDQDGDNRPGQQGQNGHPQHGNNNRHNGNGHSNGGNSHPRDREQPEAAQPQLIDASPAAEPAREAAPQPETFAAEPAQPAVSQPSAPRPAARQPQVAAPEAVAAVEEASGLPPVISTDEQAGPVETPENVTDAAPAKKDAARPAARRRAPRSSPAAGGTAAAPAPTSAPRSRKKAEGSTPKEPINEGS